jgi:hypothetical protein
MIHGDEPHRLNTTEQLQTIGEEYEVESSRDVSNRDMIMDVMKQAENKAYAHLALFT